MFARNTLLFIMIAFLLSSCSILSPVKTEPMTEYVIKAVPQPVTKKPARRITVLVTQPATSAIYDTSQMAYTTQRYQLNYFAKNKWAATPAQMLQPLIIETLQNTHYFHAVATTSSLGRYDFVLNTEIIQFQQDFMINSSVMKVTLRAQIIRTATNQVVAAKEFSIIETAPQYSPYGGVVAANRAVSRLLSQLAWWCVNQRL